MRRLLALSLLAVLTACSSSPGTTTPTGAASVATVSVTPGTASLTAGQTSQLTATAKDSAGNALSGQTIAWSSAPTTVATVSATGLVTAVSAGTATVTATAGGKSGTATIAVSGSTEVNTVGATGGTVIADHGNVTLVFPAGAVTVSTPISVTPLASLTPPPSGYIGTPYELGPTGTQFAQPVTLTMPYSLASLPPGSDPTRLRFYTLVGATWQPVPGTYADTIAHTITGTITHFSEWTGCYDPCYATSANAGLYIGGSAFTVLAGRSVSIGANGREFNFVGGVTITPQGLPAGVTANSLGFSADNSPLTLTFTAAASVPGGSYSFSMHTSAPSAGLDFLTPYTLQVIGQSYTFAANPLTVNLAQGGTATSSLSLTRQGAFTGALALTAENLPSGVTASFSPASVTGNSSTLTLTATPNAQLGDATVVLRSKTPGLADATVSLDLFVDVSHASSFTIAAVPPSVNLAPGGSATTSIQATRTNGFAGTIVYTVSGFPAGLTATVSGATDNRTLFVNAASTLALGSYPVTVTGTSGSIVQQAVVTVGVAAQGHINLHFDYSSCGASAPVWFAYQDGTGPFTQVVGSGNSYTFTLTQPKGAVAVVTPSTFGFSTAITYGTQTELAGFSAAACPSAVAGKTINATIANVTKLVDLGMGGVQATVRYPDDAGKAVLGGVPTGPQDVTAIVLDPAAPKMILRRDQDIANGGSLALFDFASSEAFVPASAQISVAPTLVFMQFSNGAPGCQFTPIFSGAGFGTTIYGIPTPMLRPADLHQAVVLAPGGVTAVSTFHTMANQTLIFGAPLPASAVSAGGGAPYKVLNASVTFAGDYQSLSLSYGSVVANNFSMVATTTYAGGNTVSLVAPNLASVTGYLTSWAPPAGSASYTLKAASINDVAQTTNFCVDGFKYFAAQVTGTM